MIKPQNFDTKYDLEGGLPCEVSHFKPQGITKLAILQQAKGPLKTKTPVYAIIFKQTE